MYRNFPFPSPGEGSIVWSLGLVGSAACDSTTDRVGAALYGVADSYGARSLVVVGLASMNAVSFRSGLGVLPLAGDGGGLRLRPGGRRFRLFVRVAFPMCVRAFDLPALRETRRPHRRSSRDSIRAASPSGIRKGDLDRLRRAAILPWRNGMDHVTAPCGYRPRRWGLRISR